MTTRPIGEDPSRYLAEVISSLPPGVSIQDPAQFSAFVDRQRRKYLAETAGFDSLSPDEQEIYVLEQTIRNIGGTVRTVPVAPGDVQGHKAGLATQLQGLLRQNSQGQTLVQQQRQASENIPIYSGIPEDEIQRRLVSGELVGTPILNLPEQTARDFVPGENIGSRIAENILLEAAAQTSPVGIATALATGGLGPAAAGFVRGAPIVGRPLAALARPVVSGPLAQRVAAEAALNVGASVGQRTAGELGAPLPLQIAAGFAGGAGALAAPRVTTNVLRSGQRAAVGAADAVAEKGVTGAIRSGADRFSPVGAAEAAGPRNVDPFDTDLFPLPPEGAQPLNRPLREAVGEDAVKQFAATQQAAAQATAPARARGAVLSLPESADEIARQATATTGVVEKLTTLVRGFRRISPELRAQLETARSAERKQIAARQFSRLGRLDPGDPRRLAAIRAAQKGQLAQFGEFESIRSAFSDDEIRVLNSQIGRKFTVEMGHPADEANALEALNKLLTGQVPTEGELKLLEIAFGPDIRRSIDEVTKTRGRKAWELFMDFIGLPRGLLSSFDISAVMRQGGILTVSHPRKALWGSNSAFVRMMKALASEDSAKRSIDNIRADQDFELIAGASRKTPVFLHDIFETSLNRREELFMSRWLQRIPGVRQSERAYATYLNEIRYKTAKDFVTKLRAQGLNEAQITPGLDRMTRFLNVATGRGTLGVAEKSRLIREMATVAFWSPRLVASRIQTPVEGFRALANINASDPAVRAASRQIARDLATYTGGMIGFLTLLDVSGLADVEADPRSSDFGKIRVGNTRLDTWGGFQQIARYTAQFIMGQRKSATSGDVYNTPRDEVLGRFIRSKLAPGGPSLAASALPEDTGISGLTGGGETFIGEPVWPQGVIDQFVPLMAQDIQEAISEQGLNGALLSSANLIGVGTQTFDTPSQNGGNLSPTARSLFPDIARRQSQSSERPARERP